MGVLNPSVKPFEDSEKLCEDLCAHSNLSTRSENYRVFHLILNCTNYIQNVHVMSSNMNQKLWCWMWITKNLWKFFYDLSNNQNQITYKKYFCRELSQNHTHLFKKKIKHTYLKVISVKWQTKTVKHHRNSEKKKKPRQIVSIAKSNSILENS